VTGKATEEEGPWTQRGVCAVVRGDGGAQAGDGRRGVHLSARTLAGGSRACGNRTDVLSEDIVDKSETSDGNQTVSRGATD
jgi:hypothetical protein